MLRSRVIATGSYVPEKIVHNRDLESTLDTNHEWILSRTGIEQRHIAADGQLTSDLAVNAAKAALAKAKMTAADIDLIVLATTTADNTFPSTATTVQHKLGARAIPAFDIQAVCSGFLYALNVADNFIRTGQVKNALVIGAETFSRIVDWTDRGTAILFGDGAGAVILQSDHSSLHGILGIDIFSDGAYHNLLYVDGGPSISDKVGKVKMQGKDVFKHAVGLLHQASIDILSKHQLQPSQIDWVIPHQANRRIIEATAEKSGISLDKFVITIGQHGNTSAASIPLAFDRAVNDNRIKSGDMIMLQALGGGFTWGAGLIKF